MLRFRQVIPLAAVVLTVTASTALAGPPLLCHPFDIGSARSLPWDGTSAWWQGRTDYNLQNLVGDTEVILTPSAPVIVRMETLRRAALYASLDAKVAAALLSSVTARANAGAQGAASAAALFDAGYLTETYKQIAMLRGERQFADRARTIAGVIGSADGTAMINRAITQRPDDASLRFAAALVAATSDRTAYRDHADKARKGAAQDTLLARNIDKLS
jgi:hypothetical protein